MATFVRDTFTGADGTALTAHTGETGATWTVHPSFANAPLTIWSNRCGVDQTADVVTACYASGLPAGANYTVRGHFYCATAGTNTSQAILGRVTTTAPISGYFLDQYMGGPNWQLAKLVNGTATVLGTFNDTFVAGQTKIGDLEITDAVKRATIDGIVRISTTDNAVTGAGRVAYRSYGAATSQTTAGQLDAIEARDAPANWLQAIWVAQVQRLAADPQTFASLPATRAGSLLLAFVALGADTTSVVGITDNGTGNAWTKQGHGVVTGQFSRVECWACPNASAITSLTVDLSAAASASLTLFDVVGTAAVFNDADTADGSGDAVSDTAWGAGTLTPTGGASILLLHGQAIAVGTTFTVTPPVGWTVIGYQGSDGMTEAHGVIARLVLGASGSYAATVTGSVAAPNGYYAIALREYEPTTPVAGSDAGTPTAAEAVVLAATPAASDAATPAATETAALAAAATAAAAATMGATETASLAATATTTGATGFLTGVETAALTVSVTAGDAGNLATVESGASLSPVTAGDGGLLVAASEQAGLDVQTNTVYVAGTDAAPLLAVEAAQPSLVPVPDPVILIVAAETGTVGQSLAAADPAVLDATETAALLLAFPAADAGAVLAGEDAAVAASWAGQDAAALGSAGVIDLAASLPGTDAGLVRSSELAALRVVPLLPTKPAGVGWTRLDPVGAVGWDPAGYGVLTWEEVA